MPRASLSVPRPASCLCTFCRAALSCPIRLVRDWAWPTETPLPVAGKLWSRKGAGYAPNET